MTTKDRSGFWSLDCAGMLRTSKKKEKERISGFAPTKILAASSSKRSIGTWYPFGIVQH